MANSFFDRTHLHLVTCYQGDLKQRD